MSCDCNSENVYNNLCNADTPYPSVSHESVPSLIDNLTFALYGAITKNVVNGRVKWTIPCDPNNTATIFDIARNTGEGLMCYIIRALTDTSVYKFIPDGNSGQILSSLGTNLLAWVTPQSTNVASTLVKRDSFGNFAGEVITANSYFAGNLNGNLLGGTAGSLVYQTNGTTTAFLAAGTNNQILKSNLSNLPEWVNAAASAFTDATNATNITSGTLTTSRLPAFVGGDVTSSIGSGVLSLTNTGAAAGTYGATPAFLSLTVNANGRITAISKVSDYTPYSLPKASSSVLGGIKVGANLAISSDGTLSATAPIVPATASVLGGIKVGDNLSITPDGTLSSTADPLIPATPTELGGIKVGNNLTVAVDGTLAATSTPLQPASATTLGGIRVGSGLTISGAGTLSVSAGIGTVVTQFVGDGTKTTFSPINGYISTDTAAYTVTIQGIDQRPGLDYTISSGNGGTLSLSGGAPANGAYVIIRAIRAGAGSADNAGYLQGIPVSATTPTTNQILKYNGSSWAGTTVTPASIGAVATSDLTTLATPNKVPQLDATGKLTTAQIPVLTTTQLIAVTPAFIGAVATADLTLFQTANKVPKLDGSGKLSTSQIPALTTAQIAQITPAVIGAVATADLTTLALSNKIPKLTPEGTLSQAQMPPLTTAQIAQITPASIAAAPLIPALNVQTSNYVLQLSDAGTTVGMSLASAGTLTIPTNSVQFSIGTQILIAQLGLGQISIVGESGVNVRSYDFKTKLTGQYAIASLIKIGTNEWLIGGEITL